MIISRPTLADIIAARERLDPYVPRTPLHWSPILSQWTGVQVYVKFENHTAVGSFKIRGALNGMLALSPEVRARGIVAASSGNHGQGVAYAGRLLHAPVIVYVPDNPNPDKVAVMRALGAEVRPVGRDFDICKEEASRWAEEEGLFFLDDGADPNLMAGAGTVALEIVQALPDVAAIYAPVGNGALAAGAGIVARAQPVPPPRVVAVQAEGAPSMYLSWQHGRPVQTERADTLADGLATRVPVPFATEILNDVVDEFVLVSDGELWRSIRLMFEATHNVAEGAGAAALAALLRTSASFRSRKVALILSGGNITAENLTQALSGAGSPRDSEGEDPCGPMDEPSTNCAK
jgi:threonine dehydratase